MRKKIEQIDKEDCCSRMDCASGPRYIDSVIVTQLVNSFALRRTRDVMPRSSAHESRGTHAGCVERERARGSSACITELSILTQATRDILRTDTLNP